MSTAETWQDVLTAAWQASEASQEREATQRPAEVRTHLALLTECGATARAVAAAAGIPLDTVRLYLTRPKISIPADHATRILALDPERMGLPRILAGGTTWRLRSLVALGHSRARIAYALGADAGTVRQIIAGDAVTVLTRTAADARRLWEAWWCLLPPAGNRAERQALTLARRLAEGGDWPCPAALDEDALDTPGYRPLGGWRPALGSGVADRDPLRKHRAAA